MKKYEYGRIEKLSQSLEESDISQEIVEQIMEGGEDIRRGTKPEKKAEWFKGAMHRMNELLDRETRYAVREACACCLGGKRLKAVRSNWYAYESHPRKACVPSS